MASITKITVWVPDLNALKEVLSAAKVEHDCGSPKRDSDGNYIINLYASPTEAEKIAALKYRVELDPTYGDVLAERQKQVSKTDRFQGGKVKPVGLGQKR